MMLLGMAAFGEVVSDCRAAEKDPRWWAPLVVAVRAGEAVRLGARIATRERFRPAHTSTPSHTCSAMCARYGRCARGSARRRVSALVAGGDRGGAVAQGGAQPLRGQDFRVRGELPQ